MDQYGNPYPQPQQPAPGYPPPQQAQGYPQNPQGYPQAQGQAPGQGPAPGFAHPAPAQQPGYPQQYQQPAHQAQQAPGYPPQNDGQSFDFRTVPDSEFQLIAGKQHVVVTKLEIGINDNTKWTQWEWTVKVLSQGEFHGAEAKDAFSLVNPEQYALGTDEHKKATKAMQKAKMCLKRLFDQNVDGGTVNFPMVQAQAVGKQAIATFSVRKIPSKKVPGTEIEVSNIDFGAYAKPDGFQYLFGPNIPPAPPGPTQFMAHHPGTAQAPAPTTQAPQYAHQQLPQAPPPSSPPFVPPGQAPPQGQQYAIAPGAPAPGYPQAQAPQAPQYPQSQVPQVQAPHQAPPAPDGLPF